MNKKIINRINGGIAIYYGIGSLLVAIAAVIGLGVWTFQVLNGSRAFDWGTVIGLAVIGCVFGLIGYAILRTGYEQIENR